MSASPSRILAAILFVMAAGLVRGQVVPSPQQPRLSVAEIERRIEAVKTASGLDETQRAAALEAYQQAITDLKDAATFGGRADKFEAFAKSAPKDLEEARAKLAAPAEVTPPQYGPATLKSELESSLEQARTLVTTTTKALEELRREPEQRAARRKELVDRIVADKKLIDELADRRKQPLPEGTPQELAAAKRASAWAGYRAAEQKLRSHEAEVARIEAAKDLLPVRIQLATREKEAAEALAKAWREIVDARSQQEAEAARAEAERARKAAERDHPLVKELTESNAELTSRTSEITAEMKAVAEKQDQAKGALKSIEDNQRESERRIEAVGLTDAIGILLRQHRLRLPDPGDAERRIDQRKLEIDKIQLERIGVEEEAESLRDLEGVIDRDWKPRIAAVPEAQRAGVERGVAEYLKDRKEYLRGFIEESEKYISALVALDTLDQQVLARSADYARFIDERVLWIRSAEPLWVTGFDGMAGSLGWLVSAANWRDAAVTAWESAARYPVISGLLALAFLLFLIGGERFVRAVLDPRTQSAKGLSLAPTIKTFLAVIIRSLHVPLAMWFLGWGLFLEGGPDSFALCLGSGLQVAAILFAMLAIMRWTLVPNGLGESHFGWKGPLVRQCRKNLLWLIAIAVPATLVVAMFTACGNRDWHNSTGRLALIILLVSAAVFAGRILRPGSGVLSQGVASERVGWLVRLRWVWFILAAGIPLTLVVLAILGYHFTALELGARLQATVALVFALVILNGLVLRWLTVSRRHLARKRAVELKQARQEGETGEAERNLVEETINELNAVDLQTRRLVRTLIGVGGILGAWLIWTDVTPALRMLNEVAVWSTQAEVTADIVGADGSVRPEIVTRDVPISLENLLKSLVLVVVTILAVRNIPGVLEVGVLQRLPIEQASRYALTTISRYFLAIVGISVAFGEIGIGWSKVQWLIAAMSVGLGFGLQEIFGNFVSGIIVLFEHRVRVGDIVTVGDVTGTVTRIRVLATTVRNWDRKEFIVPNKDLVTGRLLNWTLSDQVNRLVVEVGVAYGSDTALARELLMKVAGDHPLVMADPAPLVSFEGFGDSTLNLVLRAFLPDMSNRLKTITELHEAIDAAFKQAGIEIAFPQRDIHIRTSTMPKEIATGEGSGTV